MKFITPAAEELSYLRADPLLWEQELDVRPEVAEAIERAAGKRAGRVYWRSDHDHLYALELADLGRGRPSMALVHGHWDRWEPRPPEHEIDADLLALSLWIAEIAPGIDPAHVAKVAQFARVPTTWPEGSVLRTPDDRFGNLPDFPYAPQYVEVEGLRMAYVEHGTGEPILCLHGEPTWGFLYRHMIPTLAQAGRVIVPDLIGFGRSDKPRPANAHSYKAHVRWLRKFITALDLHQVTLVCHDWGGLIGLRVLAQLPARFTRLVAMNTDLPLGQPLSQEYQNWRLFSQRHTGILDFARLFAGGMGIAALQRRRFTAAEVAAYAAPFPAPEYATAALVLPRLVPARPDHPGAYDNRAALAVFQTLNLPVLLPWADHDPIAHAAESHLRGVFRNVAPPLWITNCGHFIQEEAGAEVALHIVKWLGA